MYLFDSDICVRILRNRAATLESQLKAHAEVLFTSTVVRHELMHGALMSERPIDQRAAVEALLDRLQVLDFDEAAADHAADIKADLQRRGLMIGANDLLIAGHARSRALIVVTGNLREFGRVDGLRCEDWPAGPAGPYLS
ncbi:type II toxin-antitoxin system VapC family toxin [Brevundimonas sp. VNH65]|uniref:type II toxin-antitoxin system VapC family toxin n=1 Tax=Brevundimonas sp. VNH65 TaxID=3400917 RepID=UPI003C1022FB